MRHAATPLPDAVLSRSAIDEIAGAYLEEARGNADAALRRGNPRRTCPNLARRALGLARLCARGVRAARQPSEIEGMSRAAQAAFQRERRERTVGSDRPMQGLGKCVVDCPPQRSVSVSPGLLKIRSGYFIDRASTEHRIGQRGSGMSHALLLVFA